MHNNDLLALFGLQPDIHGLEIFLRLQSPTFEFEFRVLYKSLFKFFIEIK